MSVPIRTTLATLPDGTIGHDLSDSELARYLKEHCDRDVDKRRELDHQLRDVLFCDGGVAEMHKRVDLWFRTEAVRERVKRMIEDARFSNATKRIVGEMSTVYAEPATRTVGGSDDNQRRYAQLCEAMCLDEENDRVNQQFNLHRAIIVGPRVRPVGGSIVVDDTGKARVEPDGHEVVLDVHSAATARAVMHPNDNTLVVAWLTRCEFRTVRGALSVKAEWMLWSDHEWEYLDGGFKPIAGTRIEHGLGVNKWIPISTGAKSTPDFWPGDEGADLIAAHITGWMVEALMIKETKAATNQAVIQGDVTTAARGQAMDSESPIEIPDGSTVTTVELGTDTETHRAAADHALERAGNNYGLSMAALKHQGVQSAEARELMLAPVRERRKRQVKPFRRFERTLAALLSIMTKKWAPRLAFDSIEWGINFGEPQVLLSKKERLELFRTEREMGLDNTVAFLMRENPDLSFDQAKAQILENIDLETWRVTSMRALQAIAGGTSEPVPDGTGQSPPDGAVSNDNDDSGAATAPAFQEAA